MISLQQSGPPATQNVSADGDGVCIRLPSWTVSLSVRVQSPTRLYWTQDDFDADKNGIDLSGDDDDRAFTTPAAVCNLWVRGLGSSSQVSVTSIGVG